MRYQPRHKAKIHRKIVEDASERVRAEGLSGAAVSAVMRDTGLTHGGFYKHFRSKDDLLMESLSEAFREYTDTLVRAAEQSPSGEAWKAIVKTYLRPEMCDHPERGCPLAALAPELARVDKRMKPQIVAELVNYKSRMVPFMPGRRVVDKERAFFAIFSTMIGAIEIARMLPDPAIRKKVLGSARDFLFLPLPRRCAMLKARSPDPAARSNTREPRFSAASPISGSVIALFQFADAATHRSLTRARAAESHELRLVIAVAKNEILLPRYF